MCSASRCVRSTLNALAIALSLAGEARVARSSGTMLQTPSGVPEVTIPLVTRGEVDSLLTKCMAGLGLAPAASESRGWLMFKASQSSASPAQESTNPPSRNTTCAVLRSATPEGWRIIVGVGPQWLASRTKIKGLQAALERMRDSLESGLRSSGNTAGSVDEPGIVRRALAGAGPVAAAAHGAWVLVPDSLRIVRLDAVSGLTVARIPLPDRPHRVATTDRRVLVLLAGGRKVVWIDPEQNRVTRSMNTPQKLDHLAGGGSHAWGAGHFGTKLFMFPESGERATFVRLPFQCLGLAARPGGVLAIGDSRVATFEASSGGAGLDFATREYVEAAAATDSGAWIAGFRTFQSHHSERLVFYDRTGTGQEMGELSFRPTAAACLSSLVWCARSDYASETSSLARFDPASGSLLDVSLDIAGIDPILGPCARTEGFAMSPQAIWVTESCGGWVVRIDPGAWRR